MKKMAFASKETGVIHFTKEDALDELRTYFPEKKFEEVFMEIEATPFDDTKQLYGGEEHLNSMIDTAVRMEALHGATISREKARRQVLRNLSNPSNLKAINELYLEEVDARLASFAR